jgi:hypothetical protein
VLSPLNRAEKAAASSATSKLTSINKSLPSSEYLNLHHVAVFRPRAASGCVVSGAYGCWKLRYASKRRTVSGFAPIGEIFLSGVW